jgi:hypothetical protein
MIAALVRYLSAAFALLLLELVTRPAEPAA